jgi:hypothetical protein
MARSNLMCITERIMLGMIESPSKAPSRVTCPHCKRRMKPTTYDCEYPYGPACWHYGVPPHKKKKWWKIKKGGGRYANPTGESD